MPVSSEKTHLTALTPDGMTEFVVGFGEPRYRAKQIFKQIHERRLLDFAEMTDLPKALRAKLSEVATASVLTVESKFVSEDG
ncbi:MAG TPA: hypothetical protein PKO33_06225, partial [Pyrinomonadaceae bacterium]|nr:hypothetical protein [Pyrinomonadaceae bacterium]